MAAFAVGFISFVSPCVLPLVPGYLSAISGLSFADLQEGRGRAQLIGPAVLFCLSFTVMFIALGMTATGLGRTLQDHRLLLRQISARHPHHDGPPVHRQPLRGAPQPRVAARAPDGACLQRRPDRGGARLRGRLAAVHGPTLSAVLTAAGNEETVGQGGVLLAFYALGLAVPFLLSALAFSSVSGLFRFFRDHYTVITVVSGVVLIVMGVLLYTNELTRLNSEALSLMNDLGINFFSDL